MADATRRLSFTSPSKHPGMKEAAFQHEVRLANAIKKGFLQKQGRRLKSWKMRYFVLSAERLQYFTSTGSTGVLKGELLINSSTHVSVIHKDAVAPADDRTLIRSQSKGPEDWLFEIVDDHRRILIAAANQDQLMDWVEAIKSAADFSADYCKAGYLTKRGKLAKTWKQRYFKLSPEGLRYTVGPDTAAKGALLFAGARVEVALLPAKHNQRFLFQVQSLNRRFLGRLPGRGSPSGIAAQPHPSRSAHRPTHPPRRSPAPRTRALARCSATETGPSSCWRSRTRTGGSGSRPSSGWRRSHATARARWRICCAPAPRSRARGRGSRREGARTSPAEAAASRVAPQCAER